MLRNTWRCLLSSSSVAIPGAISRFAAPPQTIARVAVRCRSAFTKFLATRA